MKLQLKANRRTAEYRMSNVECRNVDSLRSVIIIMDRSTKDSRQAEFIVRRSMLFSPPEED